MGDPRDRWVKEHEEGGDYANFGGFEHDIRQYDPALECVYDRLNIHQQVMLFGWVMDLLAEAAGDDEVTK